MQSTGNRKTWARIPAQSKASFFPQKDFKFFKFELLLLPSEVKTFFFPERIFFKFLVVPYERKNIIFYETNFKRKIILLIIFFIIEFFLTVAFYQFLKNDWIFINQLIFSVKICEIFISY